MNILFRCDAGNVRGSGHLMRCLTLADDLAKQGCAVTFLCRADANRFLGFFKDRNFTLHTLPAPASASQKTEEIWDEKTQLADFADCLQALGTKSFDWVIVDHYGLGSSWEKAARTLGRKIMVIDDLANRTHDCDALLDQNAYADRKTRYSGLVPESCSLMLGGQYALLREEFRASEAESKTPRSKVENILVLMGGSDYRGLSLRLMKVLKPFAVARGIGVDIVLGQENPDRSEIETLAAGSALLRVNTNHPRVSALLSRADIAFGAGGTATWEFACLGVPLLMITFADNQIRMARNAHLSGFANYIGHYDDISDDDITAALDGLIQDRSARAAMSAAGRELIDGYGASRIAGFLISGLILHPATDDDCRDIFEWRNDDLTREMSMNSDPVPYAAHRDWFKRSINRKDRILLIAEKEGGKIGMVRFDIAAPDTAIISINLNPVWRGRGLGKVLLRQSERMIPASIRQVRAEIKPLNRASINAFEDAGYAFQSESGAFSHYTKYLQAP